MTLRIGSLCTGYGGLDMAVAEVFGGSVAWHCQYDPDDTHQYAAQILAHRWPGVPNHGDITAVDWAGVEPIHIACMGFPCQDLSLAGLRAGIAEGTRSGLWVHCARAIEVLKPRLVVIENVRGILSAPADRGMESDSEDLDESAGSTYVLRALGAVLGDLAALGFDAEWTGVRAADVWAPHERFREFILAWPRDAAADADDERAQRSWQAGRTAERHAAGEDRESADAPGEGQQGSGVRGRAAERGEAAQDPNGAARGERRLAAPGQEEAGWARADTRGRGRVLDAGRRGGPTAANTQGDGRLEGRAESAGQQRRSDAAECGGEAAADTDGGRLAEQQERDGEPLGRQQTSCGYNAERCGEAAADADCDAVRQQSVAEPGRGGASVVGHARAGVARAGAGVPASDAADARGDGQGQRGRDGGREDGSGASGGPVAPDHVDIDWGEYAAAVARWETALGRPAPRPTDDRGRLSPEFVEWMMGLPLGHVTGVPGLPRTAQLKALGNGVVPPQAVAALHYLLTRLPTSAIRRLFGLAV